MATEDSGSLYNAPMNVATKLNRALLERYISENKFEELISLFEVQFDALRRAEAIQMLNIAEIRNLKAILADREQAKSSRPERESTVTKHTQTGRISSPAKAKPTIEEIEP